MKKSNLALILACCIFLASLASCNQDQNLDDGSQTGGEAVETQPTETVETEETTPEDVEEGEPFEFVSRGNGTCVIVGLTQPKDGVIEIPATSPNGEKVTAIADSAFVNWNNITSVTIPEGVTSIGASAFTLCSSLETVNLPSTLKTIGKSAFSGCSSLESVVIPEGVAEIEESTFAFCSKLTSVTLPSTITAVSSKAFSSCPGLVVVEDIKDKDGKVIYVSETDEEGNPLKEEDKKPVGSITYVCNWLLDCDITADAKLVTSISIREDTVGIADKAFGDATKLTSIEIPESVKYIHATAFESCTTLLKQKEVNGIYYVDGWAVASNPRSSAARNGEKLVLLEDTRGIVGNIFKEFKKLKTLEIPATVVSISDTTFVGCTTLQKITVAENNPKYASKNGNLYTKDGKELIQFAVGSSLTKITIGADLLKINEYAFMGCTNLEKIVVDKNNPNYRSSNGTLYTKDGSVLLVYAAGNPEESFEVPSTVISIAPLAFYNCKNLKTLTIGFVGSSKVEPEYTDFKYIFGTTLDDKATVPENIKEVIIKEGVTAIVDEAFKDCVDIEKIVLPSTVTSIGASAFSGCKKLNDIKIPAAVETIGKSAFLNCESITEITIPDGIKEVGLFVFGGCSSLEKLTVPYMGWDKIEEETEAETEAESNEDATGEGESEESVTGEEESEEETTEEETTGVKNANLGYLFASSDQDKNISGNYKNTTVPKTLVYVEVKNGTTITAGAFADCSSIVELKIPATVTVIEKEAFKNCAALTTITIPGGVVSIGDSAFFGCKSLVNLEIPETVTTMGESAFSGCEKLDSIKIPEAVTSIGFAMFAGCKNIKMIEIPANVTTIGYNAFDGCSALATITFNGNNVTVIEPSAFKDCSSLNDVTIPASVVRIGMYAFAGCGSLNSVTFLNAEGWNAGGVAIENAILANATTAAEYLVNNYVAEYWGK